VLRSKPRAAATATQALPTGSCSSLPNPPVLEELGLPKHPIVVRSLVREGRPPLPSQAPHRIHGRWAKGRHHLCHPEHTLHAWAPLACRAAIVHLLTAKPPRVGEPPWVHRVPRHGSPAADMVPVHWTWVGKPTRRAEEARQGEREEWGGMRLWERKGVRREVPLHTRDAVGSECWVGKRVECG